MRDDGKICCLGKMGSNAVKPLPGKTERAMDEKGKYVNMDVYRILLVSRI